MPSHMLGRPTAGRHVATVMTAVQVYPGGHGGTPWVPGCTTLVPWVHPGTLPKVYMLPEHPHANGVRVSQPPGLSPGRPGMLRRGRAAG